MVFFDTRLGERSCLADEIGVGGGEGTGAAVGAATGGFPG
jgi:hypothetical protein